MSKVAFVYEQDFDTYADWLEEGDQGFEHKDDYEGFSTLNVVEIDDYDEQDEDLDEDDYDSVGDVFVGFREGEGSVLEVDEGEFDADDVHLYYPPL